MNLLAKPDQSLIGHTLDVVQGCREVLNMAGDDLSSMFIISDKTRFQRILILSAWLHDIGKANTHFQAMIRAVALEQRRPNQAVRHEAVSYMIMRDEKIQQWLETRFTATDLLIASWVVAGHHRKFEKIEIRENSAEELTVHFCSNDFNMILEGIAQEFDLKDPPQWKEDKTYDCFCDSYCGEFILDAFQDVIRGNNRINFDDQERRFIAAAKVAMIIGDVLGSIQGRFKDPIYPLIQEMLSVTVTEDIINQIVEDSLEGRQLYQSQLEAGTNPERVTLIETGCGGGKTTYAYRWALQKAIGKKLYFCYPTMGTATQGYNQYIKHQKTCKVYHSTSWQHLIQIAAKLNEIDETLNQKESDSEEIQSTFRVMGNTIVACTADTVLGLMQNYRHGVLGSLGYSNGAFVFDEIHSYDNTMWSCLLRFIQFDVPCLLMTASLSTQRAAELDKALATLKETVGKPKTRNEAESIPRYRKSESLEESHFMWGKVESWIKKGAKILWVSNTIDSCIDKFTKATKRNLPATCYHSRFKEEDRRKAQERVVEAFSRHRQGAALAFTTQVAEMSLDIGADILITDLAPIANLIQRLGRLNRYLESPWGQFYVCNIATHLPYEKKEIEQAIDWLDALTKNQLSQDDIIEAWRKTEPFSKPSRIEKCQLIDGLQRTGRGSLRETVGMNLNVILPEDESEVIQKTIPAYKAIIKIHVFDNDKIAKWRKIPDSYDYVARKDDFYYQELQGASWNR